MLVVCTKFKTNALYIFNTFVLSEQLVAKAFAAVIAYLTTLMTSFTITFAAYLSVGYLAQRSSSVYTD